MENLKRQVCAYPVGMFWALIRTFFEICFYAWFFYQSVWAILLLVPIGVYRFIVYGMELERKKKQEFEGQFQECIMAVSAALRAGYSLENAFGESIGDMKTMFGEKSRIVKELFLMCKGFKNNQSIEKMLKNLSDRCGSETVQEFTDIVSIAVSGGGDLVRIIGSTAEVMGREHQMSEEIQDIISGKKMEGKIMSVIPFLMVLYIEFSNPGYFDVFYGSLWGIFVMSGCLGVYLLAVGVMERILRITK